MYIIKRNGEQNEFNIEKITNAVEAANLSVSEEKQLTYHQIMSIAEKVQKKHMV
jgi:ATP cone domain.